MKIIIFILSSLVLSQLAYAAQLSSPSKIIGIQTQAGANFNVLVESPPAYCNNGKFRFRDGQLGMTIDGLEMALSHVMFAYSHNLDVEIYHTEDGNCYSSTAHSQRN